MAKRAKSTQEKLDQDKMRKNNENVERCRNKKDSEKDRVKDFEEKFLEEEKMLERCKNKYDDIVKKNDRLLHYVINHPCKEPSESRAALFTALRESTEFVISDRPVYCPPQKDTRGRKRHANPTPNARAVRENAEKNRQALETGWKFEELYLWQGPILKELQDRKAEYEQQNHAIMNYIRDHECTLSKQFRKEFSNLCCPSIVPGAEEIPCDPLPSQSNNAHPPLIFSSNAEPQAAVKPDMELEDDRPLSFVPVSQHPNPSTQFFPCSQPLVIPEYTPYTNFYITKCFWQLYGTGVPALPADFVKQAGLPDSSPVNLLISDRSLNSALGIKDDIKCTECGWEFAKSAIQITQTDQPWKCKLCAEFWRVPRWGGSCIVEGVPYKIENTCSVDSFLAILAGQNKKNPSLITSIGTSQYETCLKNLLVAPDIDKAKEELIAQCYESRRNIYQKKINLFGADSANLVELTKSASLISFWTSCLACGDQKLDTKFEYDGMRMKPRNISWLNFIHRIIFSTPICRKNVSGHRCGGITEIRRLEVKGWLIPIDLSPVKLQAQTVEKFPNAINIGNEKFKLGGISLHRAATPTTAGHFLSLVPHRSKWVLYDGMQEGTPTRYIQPKDIAPNFTVSTLYYFISNNM